ncbi:MAG: S8 family peptidase [Desulfobaccales bacterium]
MEEARLKRPLLILPFPGQPVERSKKSPPRDMISRPSRERQAQKLGPRFTSLQETFEARRSRMTVEAAGITPEEVLVLKTAGSVEDFIGAVQKITGMEWLGEIEEEDIPPDDDFFALDDKGHRKLEKTLRGRIFLVFSNQQALNQMLSLWQRWQRGEHLPHGLSKWIKVFDNLLDIHPWGVNERLLETDILDDWRARVEHGETVIPCEVELWFRRDPMVRAAAQSRVVDLFSAMQGRIIQEAVIEDIAYHALLVELPIASVSQLIEKGNNDIAFIQCEQIQYFRATGQMAAILPGDERTTEEDHIPEPGMHLGDPVVALLDGLPLQSHKRLLGRLRIDDPDGIELLYQAKERRHGTAMASLIIHGDLNGNEGPISRWLYVRPILQPNPHDWRLPRDEVVPENSLVVDIIHRAVRRIFEGDGGEAATAPTVCIINLSIGIKDRMFFGALSPLARLLDWLAWKYQVLFIVSAGNHPYPLELGIAWDRYRALAPQDRQTQIIKSVAASARNRRLLSPAEAVNVLTVAASHDDHSGAINLPHAVEPYIDQGLPSLFNAQGMGYRRAIKPEILAPGGKVVLLDPIAAAPNATCTIYLGSLAPGQKVASPGSTPGEMTAVWHTRGTSNAAALVSRASTILYDVLEELRRGPGGDLIDAIPMSLWLKVLLAHASEWGAAGGILDNILRSPENSRQFKQYLTRLLGYGLINPAQVRECAEYRVTALSGGGIGKDQAHIHQFPLPPSLSGQHCWRRLTITLAWLTPVNPMNQKWRRAALWFEPPKELLQVNRKQADWQAVKRGTIQHEVLEGEQASPFVDGDNLEIKVNCTEDAGSLEDFIPYALATTLEVKEDIGIPLYSEVQVRVHAARIRVTPE